MAKVAYYPGCALEGSGGPYDKSTRAIVKALGLEMENLRDYNCCGAADLHVGAQPGYRQRADGL